MITTVAKLRGRSSFDRLLNKRRDYRDLRSLPTKENDGSGDRAVLARNAKETAAKLHTDALIKPRFMSKVCKTLYK